MIPLYATGQTASAIARGFDTNRPNAELRIDNVLPFGALAWRSFPMHAAE